ncbi:hypothetical protein ABPG77_009505 [Micractinium sp. CCAP 211/92]
MKLFGGTATCAPEEQAILGRLCSEEEEKVEARLASRAAQLAAKESQLAALSERLLGTEVELLAMTQQQQQLQEFQQQPAWAAASPAGLPAAMPASSAGTITAAPSPSSIPAARWSCLAAQRAELAARWQCLAEERRELNFELQQHRKRRGGAGGDSSIDFESGRAPLGDVTCAVVTHQLDTPFFSCCFQR